MEKAFGATQALRGAGLELASGEIHALVGENGSGKSTLVRILAGVHRPDAGTLELSGQPTELRARPRAALDAGIATVFQEVLVVESQSVLANVWLGADGGMVRQRVPREERERRARELLGELMEQPPPLDAPVGPLSLSDRQACCVARALVTQPRILVLDEATSSLDIETRDRLFTTLRRLTQAGTGVIFISHRMEEIEQIADRVTVMRSGKTVATLPVAEADTATLVGLMTGTDSLAGGARTHGREHGRVLFDAAAVAAPGVHPTSTEIRAGEIVGLAGLEGHGQQAFLRAIAATTGDETATIPRERRADSMFLNTSIRENFGMPTLASDRRAGLVSHQRTRARLEGYADRLGIVMGDPEDRISTLSGGNQQKVVIARWLAARPEILLLDDPTRGIDLNAKRDLYALLDELAGDGLGIVMLSSEVDEHLELMDRVIVFRQGRPFCEFAGPELTREKLVGAYFGQLDGTSRSPSETRPDATPHSAAQAPRLLRRASAQPWLFAAMLSAVLLIVNTLLEPSFADPSNWPEQLAAFAPLALVALATTPAVVSGGGGLDISVGPVAIMGNVLLVQTLFFHGITSALVCVPIVLGLSAAIGAVNGALVAYGRYQPVIATLCAFFVVVGVTSKLGASSTKVPDGLWITPLGDMVGPVPGALILIAGPLLIWGVLGRLGYLRTLYAVGGNAATAFSTGIDVRATRLLAYALGGLFAGFASLAITALFQASAPSSISTYILIALTGVALGGTPFYGGRGGLLCSLIGALAIYLLQTVLSVSGVPNVWLDVVYGTLLLIGVIVGALLARRAGPVAPA